MKKMTKAEILKQAKENGVEFVRLQFTDLFGVMKNVAITVSQLEKALDDDCMFDGSSINGFARIDESDMYLHPDLDTWSIVPWRKKDEIQTGRLICSVYKSDNKTPFEGDPRNIFQKVIDKAAEMGYGFNVGPECEFFLFKTDAEGKPTMETADEAGYFDLNPIDHGENCRRDICLALEKMGYVIEASHHEVAEGQHEIDFQFGDALTTADRVMTFKHVVKTYATKHGLHATFMPKPIHGINGSGMHTNMSLFDLKTGKNVFDDPQGELGLSKEAYAFIAGIMAHVKGIAAFSNPTVNSYKRLVPGYEAPSYLVWSASNRSCLVRIPASRGKGTRVELRCPDPTCNPYLEMALCLAAGLDGIQKGLTPPPAYDENVFALSAEELAAANIDCLPGTLEQAIEAAQADPFIKETIGAHAFDNYIAGKKAEWDDYKTRVSQWELDQYMINY
ncbi:MAG: type I glutamate--ammonia ligase [Ruminococcaceae bacterium]|nr:type I glutamate--ammonia ligase [Oscillospiraceae bacterium]